jgi:hypothetical protein
MGTRELPTVLQGYIAQVTSIDVWMRTAPRDPRVDLGGEGEAVVAGALEVLGNLGELLGQVSITQST